MSFSYRSAACSSDRSDTLARQITARPALGGLLAICAFGILPPLALAQDSAFSARLDLSQRLEWNDNPDFGTTQDGNIVSRTGIDFSLNRNTGIDRIGFQVGGDLELGTDDQGGDGLENPFLTLGIGRDVGHSRLGFDLRYSESDVSRLVTETDTLTGLDFARLDSGTRQIFSYTLSGAIGVGAPLGASFSLGSDNLSYSGTSDPSLLDEETVRFEGDVTFRIDPRMTGRVFTSYEERDVDGPGGVDRETRVIGAGLAVEISPILAADLTVSQDRVELSGAQNRVEEGFGLGLDLAREMPNGSLGFSFTTSVEENGRREEVRVSRAMDLPRGALSFSIGATRTEGLGTNPLYGIDWRQDLPRATITLALTQSVSTNALAVEQINTALNFGYTRELSEVSSISASAGLRRSDQLGTGGIDTEVIDLSLTYRRELERDWGLVGGVTHTRSTQDGAADRERNVVFIGLEKSLVWN